MQIKIDINVKPEELRRFLGLPDVAGLQEDLLAYLRDKVTAAGDFDPTGFVKGTLRKSQAWQRLLAAAARSEREADEQDDEADAPAPESKPSRNKQSDKKSD